MFNTYFYLWLFAYKTWLNCPFFVWPYMYNPKWSIDDAPDKYIMGTLCLLFVSKHVSVGLLFVHKRSVSWSFVCQFIIDMYFARWHWAVCQISSLGPHESISHLHTVYIENHGPVKLFTITCTLWRPRWNVHWYRQSFDWFVNSLHYLFSNKKD